jgi:cytoskeletal protein CcmA (bactofilin family)
MPRSWRSRPAPNKPPAVFAAKRKGAETVTYDCSLVFVPQKEDEVADYDWESFPPSKMSGGRSSFTIIDEYAGIEGKLITRNAFIHGQVQGLIFAENVTIEKTGRVSGVIFCRNLTVFGNAKANIVCDSIFVRSGGVLSATLKYKNLKIDPGGSVGGKFERRLLIDGKSRPADAQIEAPARAAHFLGR